MHAQATGNRFLEKAVDTAEKVSSRGVVATHSGTCAGFLFPHSMGPEEIDRSAAKIAEYFRQGDLRYPDLDPPCMNEMV